MIREFHQTSLRGRNSFGVEQHAARLAEFETEEDLHAIFGGGIPDRWSVLSGGNNILFTQDYDGLLLTPVSQRIALLGEEGGTVHVRADAGVEWDDLVEWAVQRGLWGIENLSLIPGKAGAAPVQNIGAYGCEAKDAIERVHMFCVPLYPAALSGKAKLAAGWLIDKAGLKGCRSGRVGIHERQALVLVNLGGATGGEILDFARMVQARVHEKFGIEIDTEVNIL